MGGERKPKPKIAADGTIPVTVRLPPGLRDRLYSRCEKDGMKLGALIVRLMDFALEETDTVLVRRGKVGGEAVLPGESKRRAAGER